MNKIGRGSGRRTEAQAQTYRAEFGILACTNETSSFEMT